MKDVALRAAHDEVIAPVQGSAEELNEGEAQVGISLLLEAQFLLSEIIQECLSDTNSTPPLSPLMGEWVDDREDSRCNLLNAE
jgi:hypothetical protein